MGAHAAADYPTLTQLLLSGLVRHPEQVLFRHVRGWTISYRQAASRAAAVAERLTELGLGRDDAVVCYLADTVPLGIFMLGSALLGVLPAPLSPTFSVAYLGRMAGQCGTRHVLTTPDRAAEVRAAGLVPLCFSLEDGAEFEPLPEWDGAPTPQLLGLLERACAGATGADPVLIQPTSGSTGQPKLVLRRHAGLTRYSRFVGAEIGEGTHRFLAVAALTHAFGCHMFATAMALGAEMVMPSRIDAAASIDEVRSLDPTVLPTTPRVLRSFCRQYVFRAAVRPSIPMFGPSARFLCSAGGRSEPKMLEFVSSRGLNIIEFYGSSEASVVALTPRGRWRQGWAGRALDDVAIKLAEDGEILLASPGLMVSYRGDAATTADAYDGDGYYRTGDIGELSHDGYLRILGRKRDVFNTPEGSNIHPERIELLLESQRWARQVMLIGDQKPYLTALVVVRNKGTLDADGPDYFLEPGRYDQMYRACAADIARVNAELEDVERIRGFCLLSQDLGEDMYCVVGPAKVRRNRKGVVQRFGGLIDWLYRPGREAECCPSLVPEPA